MTSTTDSPTAQQSRDEQDLRDLVTTRAGGMRAGDAAFLTSQYGDRPTLFTLAPPLRQAGPDEDGLRAWFAGFGGAVDYEVRDLEVTFGGDVAFCHSLNRMSATPERGGADQFTLWFRSTLGFRRIDGAWRITHEHQSTPFYMDGSFAAALDLQP